ncbi:hypothetical protein Dsin_022253 [Dipteronia sinensis]|uniref:Suppressor of forked domain-containing protein n=1 Tax=Dipteronia sinensis TaxID=43782 RepID=A0AAE0A129_9ROSI|nr:hypothetical protein Dsin_022253 [Dipteronia sinensis]
MTSTWNGLQTWSKYAELVRSLAETDRTRAIFELAIAQPALDMPELLWKAYIEFQKSQGEYERTRALYERLLDRTKHLKRQNVTMVHFPCVKYKHVGLHRGLVFFCGGKVEESDEEADEEVEKEEESEQKGYWEQLSVRRRGRGGGGREKKLM